MVNYNNAKIYALRSYQTEDIYIGRTCESLSVRMCKHKCDWKNRDKRNYYTAFEILKYDDCYIELLKQCPCENIEELKQIEGQFIRQYNCVNKRIENRTRKQWREDNKEHLKQYKEDRKEHYKNITMEWRKNNQDKIKVYKKKKTICEICNKSVLRDNFARHRRTHF